MSSGSLYDIGSQTNEGTAGTVAVPAIAATTAATVTITNANIVVGSHFNLSFERGSTTAAAGALARLSAQARNATNGSVVVDLYNAGSAALLATDAVLVWEMIT